MISEDWRRIVFLGTPSFIVWLGGLHGMLTVLEAFSCRICIVHKIKLYSP